MNFSSGTSGRQGFYDETDQQGKHHHPSPQYPSNSSSHHHHNLHRSWRDSHVGGGGGVGGEGGSNLPLELMMDSSPTHVGRITTTTTTTTTGGGEDIEESHSQAIMRELGQEGGGGQAGAAAAAVVVEKEHMFDKVVTPSDVGKLNRLVIPKQHAERYFPLDSSTNEKGLLLNFEDRNGKPWRFRYSYWNSSQSYVMTKGWSRFVKEKKLDAGDIVSFQRGVGESAKDRLFIDWRRRPDAPPQELLNPVLANLSFPHHYSFQRSSNSSSSNMNIHHHPWNPMFLQTQAGVPVPPPPPHSQQRGAHHAYSHSHLLHPQSNYINSMSTSTSSYGAYGAGGPARPYGYSMGGGTSTSHVVNPCSGSVIYFRSAAAAPQQQLGMVQMQRASHGGFHVPSSPGGIGIGIGIDPPPVVFESVPVVHGKAAAKRLRLFGVNMDCTMPQDEGNECEILPSITTTAAAATDQIMNMSNYNAHQMTFGDYTAQNHYIRSSNSSSSSSSTIPYLQLRPYSGTQIQTLVQQHPPSSSSTTSSDKGKASMSLDLDI